MRRERRFRIADRVRFHWDWATQPMQSGAGANSSARRQRIPLVRDFSHRQVIFQENVPARLMDRVQRDSRFWLQYLDRHAQAHGAVSVEPRAGSERAPDGRA